MSDEILHPTSFLMQPPPEDGSGDLFGALIRRQIYASSELYTSMDMCLSIPFLEEPRDIFDTDKKWEIKTSDSSVQSFLVEDLSLKQSSVKDHVLSVVDHVSNTRPQREIESKYDNCTNIFLPPATNILQRPYLTMASKEEVFSALHNKQYLNGEKPGLIWPERQCTSLCLRAITGIESAIFDVKRGSPSFVFIAGYSAASIQHFLQYFYEMFAIRKILDKAMVSLCELHVTTGGMNRGVDPLNDPASLALGAALEDVLRLCDSSVTELQCVMDAPTHTTSASCGLAAIVHATAPLCAILKILFQTIAPADLSTYPSAVRLMGAELRCEGFTLQPQLIDFFLNQYTWKRKSLSSTETGSYPTSWHLLSHLLGKLRDAQMLCTSPLSSSRAQQRPAVTLPGGRALLTGIDKTPTPLSGPGPGPDSDSDVSAPLDHVRVSLVSFLVRRVSLPLMEHVDRTLFHMSSDLPAQGDTEGAALTCDVDMLPPTARGEESGGDTSLNLEHVQQALRWASTRIAQAKMQGSKFGAMLKQYAAVGSTSTEEDAVFSSGEQTTNLGLVFPLHPLDAASNSKKSEKSIQKVIEMESEINLILIAWRDKKQLARNLVQAKQMEVSRVEAERVAVAEANLKMADSIADATSSDMPILVDPNDKIALVGDDVGDIESQEEDSVHMEIEGFTGPMIVDKANYSLAKQQTIDKYATLMENAETRLAMAEWRQRQAKSLNDRKLMMHDLAIDEARTYDEFPSDTDDAEMRVGGNFNDAETLSIYPTRRQQAPGGVSSISLQHDQTGDLLVNPRGRIKSLQQPGGTTSLSLGHSHSEQDQLGNVLAATSSLESPSRIKPLQQPGGTTTLSLTHNEDIFMSPNNSSSSSGIKSMQQPGGTSTLSLGHAESSPSVLTVDTDSSSVIKSMQELEGATLSLDQDSGKEKSPIASSESFSNMQSVHQSDLTTTVSLEHDWGDSNEGDSHEDNRSVLPEETAALSPLLEMEIPDVQKVVTESFSGIKSMQQPGGASTLSLAHGEYDIQANVNSALESPSRIKPLQQPGGNTALSLGHEEGKPSAPRVASESSSGIKSMQQPGGTTTMSLEHDEGPKTVREISTNDHNGVTGLSDFVETEQISALSDDARELEVRVDYRQDPGGNSSLNLGHVEVEGGSGIEDEDGLVGSRAPEEINGTSTINSDVDVNISLSQEVPCTVGSYEMSVESEQRVMQDLTRAESFLHDVLKVSFGKVLQLLCLNNNIPISSALDGQWAGKGGSAEEKEERMLAAAHFSATDLTPLACVVQRSLFHAVSCQCLAIDHSFLLLALREQKILHHIDFVQAIFLLSDESDFLVNMAGILVDTHIENNATMRFTTHHRVSLHSPTRETSSTKNLSQRGNDLYFDVDFNLFSSHSVLLAFKRAQFSSQVDDKSFFCHAKIFVNDAVNGNSSDELDDACCNVELGARDRHLLGSFSAKGLDQLALRYDAPWPFNMIVSDEYLALMLLVTRRILAVAQLTALSRHVWGNLRSCRLRERHSDQKSRTQYERLFHSAFCLIRQSFQAVSSFTSDRLRLLHESFRARVATPLQAREVSSQREQGFGNFAELIRGYIRDTVNALLVQVPGGVDEGNSHARVSVALDNLLACGRRALYALQMLVSAAMRGDNEMEDRSEALSTSLASLKEAIISVRESGEEPELWSNKDVQSLLIHMQSAEY